MLAKEALTCYLPKRKRPCPKDFRTSSFIFRRQKQPSMQTRMLDCFLYYSMVSRQIFAPRSFSFPSKFS